MFEFHGWARIRVPESDSPIKTIGRGTEFDAIKRLRAAVNEANDEFCDFAVRRSGNGMVVLSIHGLRNHRYEPAIDLFRWVAAELPDSYGLLYVFDDEDFGRGADFRDDFRVWRLAQGKCEESADSFLSPYSTTLDAESSDDSD